MNIVCMKENCEKKGHIGCCKCLLKEHHDHNLETDIVDIEQVVQKLYNIKQESTSIKYLKLNIFFYKFYINIIFIILNNF